MYARMRLAAVLAGALFLTTGACATSARWYRTDGRPVLNDPVLLSQAEADLTACNGEMARAKLSGRATSWGEQVGRNQAGNAVLTGCMADRGYVMR